MATDFKSVEGKVAIVTGAASGIGRAIAKIYAANGMKVVVADIQDELGAKVVEDIRNAGGEAIYCHTNVADEENVIKTIETAKETYGKLHVMVNNAGVGALMHPIHEYDATDYKRVTDINYLGTYYGVKYAAKAMIETDSHECSIINISSGDGVHGTANFSAYSASKAAVNQLSRIAGLDYAKHDITVNSICPGVIFTEIYATMAPEQLEISKNMIPIGRFGKPEEIGYMALFLASDMARFITGAVLSVDAGASAGNFLEIPWNTPDTRKIEIE